MHNESYGGKGTEAAASGVKEKQHENPKLKGNINFTKIKKK